MKLKSLCIKHLASALTALILVVIHISDVRGQSSNLSGYNDITRQRLLIYVAGQYLHTISQGQIDADSAVRVAAKAYGLNPLLAYNETYNNGRPTATSILLDAGKIKEARILPTKLVGGDRVMSLIELGTYLAFKPGSTKANVDEAARYSDQALTFSKNSSTNWKIASMTLKAYLLDHTGHRDQSQKMFADIVLLGKKSGNTPAAAQALLTAGELLPYGDPARLANFNKALPIFTALNLKAKEIETLSEINIEYFVAKRYDMAKKFLLRIIKLQAEINFRHKQYPYDGLAFIVTREGDLSSALTYSNKSLENITNKADSTFLGFFLGRRAMLYERMLRYNDALALFNKVLNKKTAETRLYWYKSFLCKAEALLYLGKEAEALLLLKQTGAEFPPVTYFEKMHYAYLLGETYEALKNYGLAEDHYKAFLAMAERFPPEYVHDEIPSAYFNIATFYRITGNTEKAKELLRLGKTYTSKLDMERARVYYYNLFKIDSAEGRYFNSIRDLQLTQKYTDSVFSFDQRRKVAELLVKYEAEKKDRNIKLLNSQNQLALIRAQQADKTKNITLVGIVLLLIIMTLLFNRYLIKQKSNKKLEANQRELDQKNGFLEALNTEQEKLLIEKEWLIKEVHHRVKNNLQMVTSLLYSQSVYLEDEVAKIAVNDSLRRMQAMSLIHQKLYQDEDTTTIAMPEYINELVQYLRESFDADNRIKFEQHIESVNLDVSQAVPLGLIVTESIVNAIKYAFLNGQPGVVTIELLHGDDGEILLRVSDNGSGLPSNIEAMQRNSLGLDLMQGLATQLNGRINIENNNGAQITLRFCILNKWTSGNHHEKIANKPI
ncbi:tetratricopeptide repeat-containing sensor histidine kinase [Mucilaginibacter agri]|uniref:histidine kinase n=1 Tax=Mucilaginibacter agri TaxID=2695265 RepID=A0A965ZJU7_9SPHI|nr:histidine kinase dimerization/phosphoacceptor domain -containing protein [Mucilaginibacter agri]NCD72480.1 sensor histidine kinase [Mucilaginibacter agri]